LSGQWGRPARGTRRGPVRLPFVQALLPRNQLPCIPPYLRA
jgi:hypothetical protein